MKAAIAAALSLTAFASAFPATADDRLARFEGAIGVVPVRAGPAANIVRGVNPGGVPWVISRLSVDIRADGGISVDGRGLLLGGTNNIGFVGANNVLKVKATLLCENSDAAVQRDTNPEGVAVQPDGDFRIEDTLAPWPPADCSFPVLLIRSAGNGNWFAAGILKR
jgi:hypothetical protein